MTECDTDPIFDVGSISSLEEDSLHDMKQGKTAYMQNNN